MRLAVFGLSLIIALTLLAPLVAPFDPLQTQPEIQFSPPGGTHILGTDSLGRDVFSRVLYGGRVTLLAALLATMTAWFPGVTLGLLAASGVHVMDTAVITLLNGLLAVPGLVVALVVLTLAGRGMLPAALAVGISQIAPFAYVTRAAALAARSALYVAAARGLGASPVYILRHHVLPNVSPSLLAYTGVMFSYALLNGAALNFLGLGVERSVPEWGVMLAEGREVFRFAPWVGFAPGVMMMLTVWLVNRLADSLEQR